MPIASSSRSPPPTPVGAFTGGYPVSSSPTRTTAAEQAGSSSQLTGIVAAAAVAVVLVLLTAPLSYLPIPALGGVVLVSVVGLIDLPEIRRILLLKRSEGLIALATMTGVILYGTLLGVGIAVLLAALNIVRRAAWPHIVEEGRRPDGRWRDLSRQDDARRVRGVLVVRSGGPLFFANATALQARVRELVAARPETQAVILDLSATSDVDLTAAGAIRELADELGRGDRRLAVARPLGDVRDELRIYGLDELMDPTGGTHGPVDDAILGLDLDPTDLVDADEPASATGEPGPAESPAIAALPVGPLALRVIVGSVAVVVAAVALAALLGAGTGGTASGRATVPNLIGLPLDRATTAAEDAGFVLGAAVYVQRDDRPEGTVVAQDPGPGTVADPGTAIQPFVTTGRRIVVMPDVVGQPEAQAIAVLTGAGLSVRREATVPDASVPAGSIVATTPSAGASIATGTTVAYVVSSGPEPTPTASPIPSPTSGPAAPSPSASATAAAGP